MKKTVMIVILCLLAAIPLTANACGAKTTESPGKVGLIFDSPIAGDAFSTACLHGAEQAKARFGIGLDISESLTAEESEGLQKKMAESKQYDLIFCVGPTNTRPSNKNFTDFPKQNFVLVDGDIRDKSNISSLLSLDNESSFLAGALAAMITKTGQLGFVGGMDVPAIHRFLAGFQAGAAYIDPSVKLVMGYSGSWLNDGKTKALALQQYQQGADIIFAPAGAGSLGAIEAAKEMDLYAIGVDGDQSPLAPRNIPASTTKFIDRAVFEAIKRDREGNFSGGIQASGLKEGAVGIALNDALVTATMKARINEIEQKIISAEIKVPRE